MKRTTLTKHQRWLFINLFAFIVRLKLKEEKQKSRKKEYFSRGSLSPMRFNLIELSGKKSFLVQWNRLLSHFAQKYREIGVECYVLSPN